MFEGFIRKNASRLFMRESQIVLQRKIPSREELERKFKDIDELGIYLHIPFCRQICPYCPYNKEIYDADVARRYTAAMKKEIDCYSEFVGTRPITSFYIGGGTPTTMLYSGIQEILEHIFEVFDIRCDIHMESHPNDLNSDNLDTIRAMGVQHLSTGVEALQDRHLRTLKRPYRVAEVKKAVELSLSKGFKCVNVDFMFALPRQTCREIEDAGHALVEMGVDQIAAYPLFRFPYTKMGGTSKGVNYRISSVLKRRKMLSILEKIFYDGGFERTSVWAFTMSGIPKYCSVTVPLYVGLGASGGSYLKDIFYLNTFSVAEYIKALENGRMAIALSVDLSVRMQMTAWLYWRVYETRFDKGDFKKRFGKDFDVVYGKYMKPLFRLGFLEKDGAQIVLSDRGTYWLHAFEDLFSLEYVSRLWETSKQNPWPENVILRG
jgi:oxygen-independent coproporphyrinogen-3 oxidase